MGQRIHVTVQGLYDGFERMKSGTTDTFTSAADLPKIWDAGAGDNPFLKRSFLEVLEKANPCGQEYHLTGGADGASVAVTYQHRLNLLTYGPGSLKLPVTIVGIPCSVSKSGLSLPEKTGRAMQEYLLALPGTKLILNADKGCRLPGFAAGRALPTCRLDIRWRSFDEYLEQMRSHYRYRITKAQERGKVLATTAIERDSFGEEQYRLYRNVFKRSKYKIEELSQEFFQTASATLVGFKIDDKLVASVQLLRNGKELIFMFGGMDYAVARERDLYLNMLLYIIRRAIEEGCEVLDLGQTAEDMKQKLGCQLVEKTMHAAHSGKVGDFLLKRAAGLLSYNGRSRDYNVFR